MSPEELQLLADKGYTFPRVADKYGKSVRWIKEQMKQWPELDERFANNGR